MFAIEVGKVVQGVEEGIGVVGEDPPVVHGAVWLFRRWHLVKERGIRRSSDVIVLHGTKCEKRFCVWDL